MSSNTASAVTPAAASAIRPSMRDYRQASASPHTPTRFISSTFSSPGSSSTLRQEEDAVILELNPRYLRAGFEGESGPQCELDFHPDRGRRVGDYRASLPDYMPRSRLRRGGPKFSTEASQRELWRNDLSGFDLGLLEDRLERAMREVYNKYLLTDAGTARLVLVLPSLVPLPVLSSMLTVLFERWKYPSITLLPTPTMCALAAGLRSALVVDIGWEESVVTPVYEYRELAAHRSTRGMKMLVGAMKKKLQVLAASHRKEKINDDNKVPGSEDRLPGLRLDFDFVEDFVYRMAFCPASKPPKTARNDGEDLTAEQAESASSSEHFTFDWPCHGSTESITLRKDAISSVVEKTFFGGAIHGNDANSNIDDTHYDDEEQPLDRLVYQALLQLPPDVRGTCMSRIIFTSHRHGHLIPGVSARTMNRLDILLSNHGWTTVRGEKLKSRGGETAKVHVAQARTTPADYKHDIDLPIQDRDFVTPKLVKLKKTAREALSASPQGVLRAVDSLGPWAGASLLTSLKMKGVVDIDRDRFLSHGGLTGALREYYRPGGGAASTAATAPQRASTFGVAVSSKTSDKTSWTLAGWA